MNDFYESYLNGEDLDDIVDSIVNILKKSTISPDFDVDDFLNLDKVKDRIMIRVINFDLNEKLLSEVPHRKFLDLAVCYYVYISDEHFENASVLINNSHASMWKLSEKELYEIAMKNMSNNMKPEITTLADTLRRIIDMREKDEADILGFLEEENCGMYILSNSLNHYGASSILDNDTLKRFSDDIESDFYILPSSVHELILLPAVNVESVDCLNNMINEVNETQVPKQDILSDHAYFYNRQSASVTFC